MSCATPTAYRLLSFILRALCQRSGRNYWTTGYNPGGFLTPGAVIAHNRGQRRYCFTILLCWPMNARTALPSAVMSTS